MYSKRTLKIISLVPQPQEDDVSDEENNSDDSLIDDDHLEIEEGTDFSDYDDNPDVLLNKETEHITRKNNAEIEHIPEKSNKKFKNSDNEKDLQPKESQEREIKDINKLNYHYPVVKNQTKAVLLIHQCCSITPPDDSTLVSKACTLMLNLLVHQRVDIEGQTLSLVTQWCLQCLKHSNPSAYIQILSVLKTLASIKFVILSNVNSPVISMSRNKDLKIALLAVQCLETCTLLSEHQKNQDWESVQLETAALEFTNHLNQLPTNDCILQNKILVSSLRGLQNVIINHVEFLKRELNLLLGIAKSYMTYYIKGTNFQLPQKILPSVLNIPETCVNGRERKGGKVAKQRKPKATNKKSSKTLLDNDYEEDIDVQMKWESCESKTGTSDSDISDTEHTRLIKLGYGQDRVRQAALNLLLQIIKLTDKGAIFCYWSNFISDGCSSNNLNICILKDPSPKGRMAALHVLLTLLTRGKSYLNQAESSKKYSAFTPFSVILGAMLTNLHKCLSLALNENCLTVLLQVLKCLAALVQASPYHKLTPGMTKKIIRNVKMYIAHRDVAVQIAALIVMECILGSEPVVPETKVALLRHSSCNFTEITDKPIDDNAVDSDIEFVDFSSDDEDEISETPQHLPWLLERCLANLGSYSSSEVSCVAPIKVQSLQVISAMTRNFFDCLIVPYLSNIAKALDLCLTDSYVDLRLHAARTIDFIGQAMNRYFDSTETFSLEQALLFWQILINKSLPALLECQQHSVLRAAGCDCLASIGPFIFERFSREKQILIVTLLFPSSRDEDNNVRAAAVRALAICVLYPSLRDDPGFVVDVAETIHRSLHDNCITVRIKASWSLGNLSDVLVLNQDDADKEEVPAVLLLKLLKVAIKISTDNDKVKVNAVRALGNLLQVLTEDMLLENDFIQIVHQSLDALLNNCTTGTNMKVRWNSCYAVGNALKNSNLPINSYRSKETLFESLINLVKDFPNFKVRINAALALSCVTDRETYGRYYLIIWKSLLNALENTQNIEDFSEYNHQDHLVEQICLTLGHLTNLLVMGDLHLINDSIQLHYDLLAIQMHKVLDRLLPEKSTILLMAGSRLKDIGNEDLTKDDLVVLNNLYKIFIKDDSDKF
ncbi:hypothetical protein FQR65_LT01738 [Abscondita terminalis]|nr:hypothetical protein FQR65_LT01738 [Abscondita terminalis]